MKKLILLAAITLAAVPCRALPIRTTGCAPTAEAAVAHLLNSSLAVNESADGFRIDAIHHDNLRNRTWATVASCANPAKPHIAVLLPRDLVMQNSSVIMQSSAPVIHAGDRVKVISRTGDSSMELLGWAEEPGAEKQQIRVRLSMAVDAEHAPLSLRCAVINSATVEVVR